MRLPRILFPVLILAFLTAPLCLADTIDQGYSGPPLPNSFLGVTFPGGLAQTFTAGLNGTLAGVNLDITVTNSSAQVLITTVVPNPPNSLFGQPSSTVLGSTTLSTGTYTLSQLITFPQVIASLAGTTYAIVLLPAFTPAPGGNFGSVSWVYGGANGGGPLPFNNFTGGQAMIGSSSCAGVDINGNPINCQPPQWFVVTVGVPSAFRFQTHVNTAPAVPEPSTLLLLGTGVAALLARRRRLS